MIGGDAATAESATRWVKESLDASSSSHDHSLALGRRGAARETSGSACWSPWWCALRRDCRRSEGGIVARATLNTPSSCILRMCSCTLRLPSSSCAATEACALASIAPRRELARLVEHPSVRGGYGGAVKQRRGARVCVKTDVPKDRSSDRTKARARGGVSGVAQSERERTIVRHGGKTRARETATRGCSSNEQTSWQM